MANNPYVNKVVFGSATLVDLTGTTATADKILEGYGAFGADGAWMDGTATGGGSGDGYVWQDGNGYVHLSDEQGTQTIIDALTVSSSGTTTAPTGHAYSPVTVPSGTASTPATSVTANPSISVSSGGLITATASATKSVTPSVSVGWVSSGTAGTITVSGSNTSQLSTQAGATITPTESEQTAVTSGKYTTGAIKVGAISSSYVGSGITRRDSTDLSASGATVTAPSGYYASSATKTVASGTEGTPTATKGTVSSHSITVTPSVTNTAGYISGGTHNGTAVTVSASELVSGTKSISANGTNIDVTNYAAVNVSVPTGSATLTTKTITQNGTYNASSDNADGYSQVTVNVSGGGGGGGNITDPIRFFDYDGTLIASYTTVPSSLPSVPTHTGLTNGTWNYTLQQITTQFNAVGMCDIGANFETSSGDTEIDIVLHAGRLSPRLRLAPNGTVTISWGDGTTSTATGTSLTTTVDTQHNYASAGSYTISIHVNSGSYAFYSAGTYWLLNKGATTTDANKTYSNCVKSVRVGNNANISNYAFAWCLSLESVSIPSTISSLGTSAFFCCYSLNFVAIPSSVTTVPTYLMRYCYAMDAVSIPSGVTSIGDYAFSDCYSLERVSIPSGVTSIGTYAFYYNYALTLMNIPSGVTSITSQVLRNCYSLAILTIPSGVTSIAGNAFTGCYGMSEYHIKPTTPPTLTSSAFNNIQSDCVMYVPSASLDTYKGANNWSTYASYMVGE